MNVLDLIFIIPLLYGAYRGYIKGLFIEIIGVVAFVIAIVVGFKFLGYGMNLLAPAIGENLANRFLPYLSFSIIFFPTIFLINKLGWMMRRALRFTILGTIDGFAGALVGVFTWLFGISTFLWLMSAIDIVLPKHLTKESITYPVVTKVAPTVISKVSDWIPAGGNLIRQLTNHDK
ncbi:CvpA family protein [Emticicia sp. 17c]|uniref:CvpA family protein n=1 Tax=Emticicia sp. 17c TaxID=3127704 RepID=UPI00301BC7E6